MGQDASLACLSLKHRVLVVKTQEQFATCKFHIKLWKEEEK